MRKETNFGYKSHIRETLNLSTCADSSTDTKISSPRMLGDAAEGGLVIDRVKLNYSFLLKTKQNIARSQIAASHTSHQLSRCQIVFNKRLLSEIFLLIIIGDF